MIASVFVLHRLMIGLDIFQNILLLTRYLMCCIYLSRSTNSGQHQTLLRVPNTDSDLLTYFSKLYL